MERKYTISKKFAAHLINIVHEDQLPITIHEGNERINENGDKIVDLLLECDDPDLLDEVIDYIMFDMMIYGLIPKT